MKLLWLVNIVLPEAADALVLPKRPGGSWLSAQIAALRPQLAAGRIQLTVLALSGKIKQLRSTQVEGVRYLVLPDRPGQYHQMFGKLLAAEQPDLIHIHGTEYPHSLVMLQLANPARVLVSVQGLASECARHYMDGLPARYRWRNPVKLLMKRLYAGDVIADAQRMMEKRGQCEQQALQLARHVAGRTRWDKACVQSVNPAAQYHHCGEVLRQGFYKADIWEPENCRRQSIFVSQAFYPIKGVHLLLEQMPAILQRCPDAHLYIAGQLPYTLPVPGTRPIIDFFFEYQGYLRRLCRKHGLETRVTWLGPLDATKMQEAYLAANVFLNPSSVENSPNSVAEAMLLGVPVIASDVGGVADMLADGAEGDLYPAEKAHCLPEMVQRIFADDARSAALGRAARTRALQTYDVNTVTDGLLALYGEILHG